MQYQDVIQTQTYLNWASDQISIGIKKQINHIHLFFLKSQMN
jgi:hypothetical protein